MLVPTPPHNLSQHLINTQNLSWVDAQPGEVVKMLSSLAVVERSIKIV